MIDESAYKAGVQRVMAERDAALERAEKAERRHEKRTRQWSTVSRQASDLEERCRALRERVEKAERERDELRARLDAMPPRRPTPVQTLGEHMLRDERDELRARVAELEARIRPCTRDKASCGCMACDIRALNSALVEVTAERDEHQARVLEMVEQTDTIPGSDFRKQMEFNEKRYKSACKRVANLRARVAELEASNKS